MVDPNGMQLSVQPNVDAFGNPQFGMSMYHYNPQPGRWRFTLVKLHLLRQSNVAAFHRRGSDSIPLGDQGHGAARQPGNAPLRKRRTGHGDGERHEHRLGDFGVLRRFPAANARSCSSCHPMRAAAPTRCPNQCAGDAYCRQPRSAPSNSLQRPPRLSKWMFITMWGSTSQRRAMRMSGPCRRDLIPCSPR